ncbi:hypothetical protein DV736_g26, partial [Chaetothyriales sp. CBS 134916]
MRDGSAVQWHGRRHIAIFIRSLHLLDLDLLEDWPGLSEQTFTPRALQQTLQQRVKGVEWTLFRLFELYSPTEARDKLRPFFPPLTSLQSVNLQAALIRALTELKKNGALPKEIVLRKTMLDECKGERLEELLAAFSMLVLRKTLSRSAASSPVSECAIPEPKCAPLILAYRVSLQQVLSQRRRVETQAGVKMAQLERQAQSLSQRRARTLEQGPGIEPLERGRVVGLLKDEWTGDSQWIKAILYENIQGFDDNAGEFSQQETDSGYGPVADNEGLLHDLNRRLRVQEERLARWRKFEESFPSQAEHGSVSLLYGKPMPKPSPYSFNQHQAIIPRLDTKPVEGNSNGVRHEHLLTPFAAILHHLDSELGRSRSLTIGRKNQGSRPNSRETPSLPREQESKKETTWPPKPLSSEFSWLDESEARSRDNDDSLPSLSVHSAGHVTSFADRVRRSQAPLFSSDDDYTADIPEAASVLVKKRQERAGKRQRQSIAAFHAKPRTETKAARGLTSHIFPTNPFETPGRSSVVGSGGGSIALPSSSKESTPREQLFSDDADSASIFKSRPRLAQSPILPAAASGPDDSVLAGEMTILDIGSNDVGYASGSMISQMAMAVPGAFLPSRDETALFYRPSARSALFIPPSLSPAPSRSSSSHSKTRPSVTSTITTTRKRPRPDTVYQVTRISHGPQPVGENDEPPSPGPLVNTDYRIAGGLDTPRAERTGVDEASNWEMEKDLRVNRFNQQPSPTSDSFFPHTPLHPGDSAGETGPVPARPNTGWGHTLWSLTGSVAGKLINFCWTTAFHGFHAGGGRGYHMQLDTPTVTAAETSWPDTADDVFDARFRGRGATPIPGEFPGDDSVQDYWSRVGRRQETETLLRADKDHGGSSLRRNWVMVASPSDGRSESTSPVRKKQRPSTTGSLSAHPIPRSSYSTRPRKPIRTPTGGASYASSRSSTRSGSSSYASPSSFRPPSSDHGGRGQYKPSCASPRQSGQRVTESSPKSSDVLRFEKKFRHNGQRQSDSIKRMNERMQLLLREGQQALASKIDVSDPVDDEGYGGDEFDVTAAVPTHQTHAW